MDTLMVLQIIDSPYPLLWSAVNSSDDFAMSTPVDELNDQWIIESQYDLFDFE